MTQSRPSPPTPSPRTFRFKYFAFLFVCLFIQHVQNIQHRVIISQFDYERLPRWPLLSTNIYKSTVIKESYQQIVWLFKECSCIVPLSSQGRGREMVGREAGSASRGGAVSPQGQCRVLGVPGGCHGRAGKRPPRRVSPSPGFLRAPKSL